MWSQQILVLFLRALMAAKKSLNLYPAGSEMATAWVQRLHASLDDFVQQGLTFPIRVGRDRFTWGGEDLLTPEPALEAFRFDLETRGVADFSVDPAVEDWELQAFLELLSLPAEKLDSLAGAAAYLRSRNVLHVSVGTPGAGDQGSAGSAAEASLAAMQAGKDPLDLFVDAVLEMVEERLADLTYDRTGLLAWLEAVSEGDQVERLYGAVKTLGAMAEGGGDREVRTRTMLEAILLLPEATLRPLLGKWLVPLAGSDLVAFNLLTQVNEDELAEIARLVPPDQLMSLTTELLEFPWEEGKRQRLLEAITWTLRRREAPEAPGAPAALLSRNDPLLVSLREEIVAACHPDVLLDRSADILLALIFDVDGDEYPGFAVDALEEIVGEALARGRLPLAVRILSSLGAALPRGGDGAREHARRVALFRRRVAGRTHVSLVAGLLRQEVGSEQVAPAAEYLRLVTREGGEEFMTLLADERDRRVRARMCQVLARVGSSVIPSLLPRLDDKRWYVVRNVVYILGRIGHESTFMSVVSALDHAHPRVRIEAVRALGLIGGAMAAGPLVRCVTDPDPTVRRAVVKALGELRSDDAVPALRDLVTARAEAPDDWVVKQDAVSALAAVGTPFARAALTRLAGRRAWFWQRTERRIRGMAAVALGGGSRPERTRAEADDGE